MLRLLWPGRLQRSVAGNVAWGADRACRRMRGFRTRRAVRCKLPIFRIRGSRLRWLAPARGRRARARESCRQHVLRARARLPRGPQASAFLHALTPNAAACCVQRERETGVHLRSCGLARGRSFPDGARPRSARKALCTKAAASPRARPRALRSKGMGRARVPRSSGPPTFAAGARGTGHEEGDP